MGVVRSGAVVAARALVDVERRGEHRREGCASIGEYGERNGTSAGEARQLFSIGLGLERCADLESRVLAGRISLASAAIIGIVYSDPTLLRPEDRWLHWAETETHRELRRRLDRRREEVARYGAPVVALTLFVSSGTRKDFRRARAIASRKADRILTEGQTFEVVVGHYLDAFDASRRRPGTRRLPHTSGVRGRYVPNAVRRDLMARDGDSCAVPLCDHDVFLENAHVVSHVGGGSREVENLVRLCSRHHRILDSGRLRISGTAEAPEFRDEKGRPLGRRRASARSKPQAPG